jgi:glycine dehydrogenase
MLSKLNKKILSQAIKSLPKANFYAPLVAGKPIYQCCSTKKFEDNKKIPSWLKASDSLIDRHIGVSEKELNEMLKTLNVKNLDQLMEQTIPKAIADPKPFSKVKHEIPEPFTEDLLLKNLKEMISKNKLNTSYIGCGYYGTIVPGVIQRNVLENPGWYTAYTPYQAEISQGRLESLLNYQTMICELTGMEFSNASLLDEGTAAAEGMFMCYSINDHKKHTFFISSGCFPQTIDVVKTKAKFLKINVIVGDPFQTDFAKIGDDLCGVLLQTPSLDGGVHDFSGLINKIHTTTSGKVVVATDLLALVNCKTPAEAGADIAVGSAQRFGVPMGYGGPHAAFLATKDDFKRKMPGRVIGVSIDKHKNKAYRMSMQTREQHIRREKATSNICTAQALLANMAAMYAIYHGKQGLKTIAKRVNSLTQILAHNLRQFGYSVSSKENNFFDTVTITGNQSEADKLLSHFVKNNINLRHNSNHSVSISLDETTTLGSLSTLLSHFASYKNKNFDANSLETSDKVVKDLPSSIKRKSDFLNQDIFNSVHSEHQMLRYLFALQSKDLSLNKSMISLGSCTMKLNATTEMKPVTWPEFGNVHPFTPLDQAQGYQEMLERLSDYLKSITKFDAFSLQPNSGAQGEYAGLLAIKAYYEDKGEHDRDICLIPVSAHGTNPASAILTGMKVVTVKSDAKGNIDLEDLKIKAKQYSKNLAAFMATYPSTHGVYEETIIEAIEIIHTHGGQVYMDGANMNAQVGWTSPGFLGADVGHLNLHKTFCIPHGGGGPGMGPIGVKSHLAPFLPGNPVIKSGGEKAYGSISSAPYASASILPISYVYIVGMGKEGLRRATAVAILNANYLATRLKEHYKILYLGHEGRCAHEFILDIGPLKDITGISEEDIAKRLADYGFHAPTMSFPVPGTLMIEPTESEDKGELDRFAEAMIQIREEIRRVENGTFDKLDNPLKNAPHTAEVVTSNTWNHKYTREEAAFPLPWVKLRGKYWPTVGRVDNAYGDRNLICTCPPTSDYF